MRERRREEALPEVHELGVVVVAVAIAVVVAAFDCLRVMGCSGRRIVDEAGLEPPTTLDETELLRGLSQGVVLNRLREAGLSWADVDATTGSMTQSTGDGWIHTLPTVATVLRLGIVATVRGILVCEDGTEL